MKAFNIIVKLLTALATLAGIVYIIATYGEQIVAWAKKMLANLPKCPCCEKAEEAPVEEPAEEAEDAPAEEAAVEEAPAAEAHAEEAPIVDEPVAEERDFAE